MAKMNFGGVVEDVVTKEEFPLEKARDMAFMVLVRQATFAIMVST